MTKEECVLTEIRALLTRLADDPNADTEAVGVRVHVERSPAAPVPVLFEPMVYLVFQGRKRLIVGARDLAYGPGDLVTMAVDLPALVEVTEASDQVPYLSLEIPVDRAQLAELVAEMPPRDCLDVQPVSIGPLPPPVLEPALRLLRLIDTPADAKVLAAGVHREILYRILSTPGGDSLRSLVVTDSVLASIGKTTQWMQQHLDTPIQVRELAAMANMSVTSFYRRFKQATGTSPASYRKTVRLHEARRQLAARNDSVSNIAAAVGYISPSQFSREYKRAFGSAPSRDTTEFRVAADAGLSLSGRQDGS